MAQKAAILAQNISVVAATAAVLFGGGRGVLVIEATSYPTTCQLQTMSMSGKWVPIGSNITADGLYAFDYPQGQYRLNMSGGAATALYANLVSVSYN